MKVLIVDDESDVREILVKVFQAKGFEILEAADGQAAMDQAQLQKPDLIILDIMLPKLSGWEACRELKKGEKTKNIPIVVLTAKVKDIDELMSAEVGADLYIKKPFDPLNLVEQAQNLMEKKK